MMKSLWTGASGMITQQTNLDTISNNLANVNTTGYKKETAQFSSLMYQKLQTKTTDAEGNTKPVIGQVGLGVKISSIVSRYGQGTLQETGNDYDLAIEGDGFFMLRLEDGSTAYTRNGGFGIALGTNGITLANADGYPVLDANGQEIVFDDNVDMSSISITDAGQINYTDADGVTRTLGQSIGLAQFSNTSGLIKQTGSLLAASDASGEPQVQTIDARKNKIHVGYLEGSNVETAEELVNMIVAQRAYQMNSKTIQAADEMLQQANNLRG